MDTPTRRSPRKKKGKPVPKKKPDAVATPKPPETSTTNNEDTPKPEEKKRGFPRWSVEEDKKLCVAWLNTSRDAIVGNGQKAATFWERIHEMHSELINEYNEEKKGAKGFKELPLRPVGAVECRWAHILKVLNKFSGCYSNVERRMKSGKTREDVLTEAKELYKTSSGSCFNLDHCWGILKDTPKWQATQQENDGRGKKAIQAQSNSQSTVAAPSSDMPSSTPAASSPTVVIDADEDDPENSRSVIGNVRLEGQKAAKRKRAEDNAIEKIISMQRDLVQISRERLSSMQASMRSSADEAVMSKDLSMLDEDSRTYYQKKKRAIIAREIQEEKEMEEKARKERDLKEKKEKEEKQRKEKEEKQAKEKAITAHNETEEEEDEDNAEDEAEDEAEPDVEDEAEATDDDVDEDQ
ncbi:uncharacterized protein PGTG_22254 [Puccinia graminis f. sp. tritici CRL 75-36-700-3]|uniref:No apical meristem-associated C-terminal domain-containing protein n=1 Tax=Puccinia graminis f. sp. tritici (strain CRL 75-36-700-3 / race SCCL) TaxID=418459 RepID=H6QU04_PUCGT|nr:uncharacterized protein PGTG_22254 [Puccinia graminis f. sp. tritici CRL 75-36-700-3]EHS64418.1 hypothetical protein PGTG_22254 [Puccinia graminis f. sp. tritici CRL 75-36-700-3]